jgi:heme A synthase
MATPADRAPAEGVARAHRVLALVFFAGALIQFVLAGYAAFGGSNWDAHRGWGSALTLIALILVILAAVGRRPALQPSAVLLGLMILQHVLGRVGPDAPILGALHPLVGLAVLGTAMLTSAGTRVRFGPPHRAA